MKVEHWCNMTVVAAEADVDVRELAQMMRDYDAGQVVIIREIGTLVTPVGIVTDRDLALRPLLDRGGSSNLTASDIMSRQLLTVLADDELDSALAAMRGRKVSRAPVTDEDGALIGILLLRDVLASMANMTVEMFASGARRLPTQESDDPIPTLVTNRVSHPPADPTRIARYQEDWVTFDFNARRRRQP